MSCLVSEKYSVIPHTLIKAELSATDPPYYSHYLVPRGHLARLTSMSPASTFDKPALSDAQSDENGLRYTLRRGG